MIKKKSVSQNTLFLLLKHGITLVMQVLVIGYVARTLGKADYGKLIFALSFVQMFSLFTDMGLHIVQVKEISRDRKNAKNLTGVCMVLRIILGVIAYGLVVILVNLFDQPEVTKTIVYITGASIICNYIIDSVDASFKGAETMQFIAVRAFFAEVLGLTLRVLLLFLGFRLIGIAWGIVAASVINSIVSIFILRKYLYIPKIRQPFAEFKRIISMSVPYYLSSLTNIFNKRLNIISLGIMSNDISVGLFGAAYNFIPKFKFIPSSIVGASFPAMNRLFSEDKKKAQKLFKKTFLYLFVVGLPIATIGSIIAEDIIILIFGLKFKEASQAFRMVIWFIPLSFLSSIMGNTLFCVNRQKIVLFNSACIMIINLSLCLTLIPNYSYMGAAFARVCSGFIGFLINLYFCNKFIIPIKVNMTYVKIVFANICTGFLVFYSNNLNWFFCFLIGVFSYALFILLLNIIDKDDMNKLKKRIFPANMVSKNT